jgi:site-specific recombinase XerD
MPARNPVGFANRGQIASFVQKNRLPSMYGQDEYVDAGGLMSYGPNNADLWRRAATYVDKILKGTKPADLPVERPTKFELVINLTVLKHMFKMGVQWELMQSNPAALVSPFSIQEGRFCYLAEEEIPRLLDACENQVTSPWLYPLVVLALNTGARQGELADLQFEDVDLESGLIYFGQTKNRKLKTIPINKTVRQTIVWLQTHRYGEYLFTWPWGERVGRTTIYEAFQKACRAAGIEKFRFHDLRHTAASYLVMGGIDLATVKEILGHREIEMTLRYSHLAPAHKAQAVEKLGEVLEKITNRELREAAQEPKSDQADSTGKTESNSAQIRNVFLVRSGRGLSVVKRKEQPDQSVTREDEWWRRGESNPRPKVFGQI